MNDKYLILNLPDTPDYTIHRDWAGTFGTGESKKQFSGKRILPIWILYSISALKKSNIEFKIIDAQIKNYDNKKTVSSIVKYNPDVIISLPCLPSYKNDIKILNQVKELLPKTKIILFGGIVNTFSEKILNESKVDYLINGRYPFYSNLIEFIKNHEKAKGIIYKKDGKIIKNSKLEESNDLNKIIFEAYDLINIEKYLINQKNIFERIPILTGVGCPYACTYCAYPIAYGKKFFYKDIDRVIDEISYIVNKFNVNGFLMRDVVFTKDKKRVTDFCNKVIDNNLNIKFLFETRVDLIDEKIIDLLKNAGCYQINFGVESGNSEILKNVGKPGVNIKQLKNALHLTRKTGIFNMAHIILGLPGENKKTIEDTYKLLKKIKADEVNFNYITPYPGTKLYEYAKSHNLIVEKDWANYTSHTLVMRSEDLSIDDLKKAGNRIEKRYTVHKLLTNHAFRKNWIKKYLRFKLLGKT